MAKVWQEDGYIKGLPHYKHEKKRTWEVSRRGISTQQCVDSNAACSVSSAVFRFFTYGR